MLLIMIASDNLNIIINIKIIHYFYTLNILYLILIIIDDNYIILIIINNLYYFCVRHGAKCLTNITVFNILNKPMRSVLLFLYPPILCTEHKTQRR